jgi:lipopolysaccharide export system permease protein
MNLVASRTAFWYLVRRLIVPILMVLAAFTLVDMLGEGSDRFAGWVRAGVELEGFKYLALRLPFMISQLLPVAVLGGTMFAFAMLHRAEEITALQAIGISRSQLALPVFAIALVLTLANFTLAERVAPLTNRWARGLLDTELKHGSATHHDASQIWVRTRDGFLMARHFDRTRDELQDVTVFRVGPYPDLHFIMEVQRATWNGRKWILSGARDLNFNHGAAIEGDSPKGSLEASPADLNSQALSNPDELGLSQLDQFIAELQRNGFVPADYLVVRALKFALPFSCLVMAALGFASSLEATPRHSGVAAKIGFALASGVGYWMVLGFSVSLGKSGIIPPWPAAWMADLVFGLVAISLFLLGEEKRSVDPARSFSGVFGKHSITMVRKLVHGGSGGDY